MTGKREKTAALSKGRQQGGLQKAALYFWKHKYLYLMLLPAILYYIIFCYVPMYGVTIAFKDFNPMLGIWKSPWAGTEMFQKLFGMEKFYSVFWNTIRISLIRLIFGFPLLSQSCTPWAEGIFPVRMDALAGEHTGEAQKKLSNRIPCSAILSRLGV